METKICYKCGIAKPLAMFNKNNQQADGLTGMCKECLALARKGWDNKYNHSEKARIVANRYYYSEKGQATKKAYRKSYVLTEEQREKYRLAQREHEKEEKYKARRKRYDQSPKGKKMKARKDKKYAKTPNGRFSKRKTEIKRKYQVKASDCLLTKAQWEQIKAKYENRCAYCNRTMIRLEMDHVIPLSKGGTHIAENIVPACRTCNAKKGNREQPHAAMSG